MEPKLIFVVQGEHWSTPGRPLFLFSTRDGANAKAADLINGMLVELDLAPCTDWEEGLKRVKAEQGDPDDVDVWIFETEIDPE